MDPDGRYDDEETEMYCAFASCTYISHQFSFSFQFQWNIHWKWQHNVENRRKWYISSHCSLHICLLISLLSYGCERRSHEATLSKIWTDKLVFGFHLPSFDSNDKRTSIYCQRCIVSNYTFAAGVSFLYLFLGAIFAKMKIHIKIIAYWKDVKEFSISLLLHIAVRSVVSGWLPSTFACITL